MRLPDFLVVGAQRAGTTWLYKNLRDHPGVFMPAQKELEFFSHDPNYKLGIEHYAEFFAPAPGTSVVGEASPSYLWSVADGSRWDKFPAHMSRLTPQRVYQDLGRSTKILVSVRNPIHRAASAMLLHANFGRLRLEDGLLNVGDQAGIVHMGFYALHLKPWLELFEGNVLVLIQEETERQLEDALRRVYEFVGVDAGFRSPRTTERSNRGPTLEWREDGAWMVEEDRTVRIATPGDIEVLRSEYRDDVRRLSEILGRDLADVWQEFA